MVSPSNFLKNAVVRSSSTPPNKYEIVQGVCVPKAHGAFFVCFDNLNFELGQAGFDLQSCAFQPRISNFSTVPSIVSTCHAILDRMYCSFVNPGYSETHKEVWDIYREDNDILTNNPNEAYITIVTEAAISSTDKSNYTPVYLLCYLSCDQVDFTGFNQPEYTGFEFSESYLQSKLPNLPTSPQYITVQTGIQTLPIVDTSKCFTFKLYRNQAPESLYCFVPQTSNQCKNDPITDESVNVCFPSGQNTEADYVDTCTDYILKMDSVEGAGARDAAYTLVANYYPDLVANRCTEPYDVNSYKEMSALVQFQNQPYSCWWRYCQDVSGRVFVKSDSTNPEGCKTCLCVNTIDLDKISDSTLGNFTQTCSVECGGEGDGDGDGDGDVVGGNPGDNTNVGGTTGDTLLKESFFSENPIVAVFLSGAILLFAVSFVIFAISKLRSSSTKLKEKEISQPKEKSKPKTTVTNKSQKKTKKQIKEEKKSKERALGIFTNVALLLAVAGLVAAIFFAYREIFVSEYVPPDIISITGCVSNKPAIKLAEKTLESFNEFVKENELFTGLGTTVFNEDDEVTFFLKQKLNLEQVNKLLDGVREIFTNRRLVISVTNIIPEPGETAFFSQEVKIHEEGIDDFFNPTVAKNDTISRVGFVTQYDKVLYPDSVEPICNPIGGFTALQVSCTGTPAYVVRDDCGCERSQENEDGFSSEIISAIDVTPGVLPNDYEVCAKQCILGGSKCTGFSLEVESGNCTFFSGIPEQVIDNDTDGNPLEICYIK